MGTCGKEGGHSDPVGVEVDGVAQILENVLLGRIVEDAFVEGVSPFDRKDDLVVNSD